MNTQKKGLWQVHIAVLLFGMSSLFAKMVDLPGIVITFGRVLFSSLFLWLMLKMRSSLFAKMVDLPGIVITFGRVLFSSLFLWLMLKMRKTEIRLTNKKDYGAFFIAGIILAVHWTTFMLSIQLSTVAVGTITFSTNYRQWQWERSHFLHSHYLLRFWSRICFMKN